MLMRVPDHLNGDGKVSQTCCILCLFALAMAAYCYTPNPELLTISPGEMTDWVLKSQGCPVYWSSGKTECVILFTLLFYIQWVC